MVKLADTADLSSAARKSVGVRLSLPALTIFKLCDIRNATAHSKYPTTSERNSMNRHKLGLVLVGVGIMMLFAGIGTSDMEVASGIVKSLTGVNLGIIGFMSIAIGAGLIRQDP